jgi:hypothetical protein
MFSRAFIGIIASSRGGGIVLTQSVIYDDPNYYPACLKVQKNYYLVLIIKSKLL